MESRQLIICLSSLSSMAVLSLGLVIFLFITPISASYSGNESDHLALLSFKSMINQDPYGALTSWNTSIHFCDWKGVSCGKRHRRVTAVRLISQGLQGSLSPHVGNLSFLRQFWLRNNSFQGTIPCQLGRLSRLRFLGLERNNFNGVIPTNLSGCSSLEVLTLGYNKLVGSIPKEISFLRKLTTLAIHSNNLTGGIPPFLGNITSMEVFSVTDNPFGGSIPDNLGRWKFLREVDMDTCKLIGNIPHSFFNFSLLSIFSLFENHLNGSIPSDIGEMLPRVSYLQLGNNQLTGLIPPSISNCSRLKLLQMSENKFSGKLTIDFSKLRDINDITLYNNNLSELGEVDDMKFIDSLTNCTNLQFLVLYNCKLQGVLPRSIFNLSNQFNYLDLGANQLYGNLSSGIGNLVGLSTLYLDDNRFTGNIPSTIGELRMLEVVALEENQFSGLIPDAIGNLLLLVRLYLDSNRLEGHIPSSLGKCHHLSDLSFNNNKLSGKIPKQLLQISSMSIRLDLSQNTLSGSLPTEVGNLKMLNRLDLSDNKLSGDIPSSLGHCVGLTFLFLERNLFEGMIPTSFSSLRGLEVLDLSENNLSGPIPPFLKGFTLGLMNLSFNNFEGEVPVTGVYANTSEFSVMGNSRLCGGLAELGLPKCKETQKHHKNRFPLFAIIILITSSLFSALGLVYVLRKKNRGQPSQSSRNEGILKVSYSQLLKATNGFNEANLIGIGGSSAVYRGLLDHDGSFVAVKVLHLQNRGAHKSFIAECEAWRSIRHRNVLKIITSCSSVDFQGNDFKALVYEFMPNGSLHDWLHCPRTSRLNILQRISILIDVASALDYLHNCCPTTIIHCDLKPSNVLLDDDMVAHVGDFGLSRFLETHSSQNTSSGVKGTIGYAPPEYGLGTVMTTRGDVYSFGILLLEVMTGKKPTDDIFNEDLSLHKLVYMALPEHVMDVIDGDAIVLQSTEANALKMEECIASTMKIGVSCSMDSPLDRMNIENVVHELQHILSALQSI